MIREKCKGNGKHCLEEEARRKYYIVNKSIPKWNGDECDKLPLGFVDIDVVDYDKNGNTVGFIRGEPRSDVTEIIIRIKGFRNYGC
jgi:hypothetical protein